VRQRNYTNWFLPHRENESAHDLDSLHTVMKTIVIQCLRQTDDAKLQSLTLLSESASSSQYAKVVAVEVREGCFVLLINFNYIFFVERLPIVRNSQYNKGKFDINLDIFPWVTTLSWLKK
jgi:hypothetical protein